MPTAIISNYTPQGFVVASDGLGTKTHPDEAAETSAQKIFPIEYPGRILAYALMGHPVISEDADRSVTVVDIPSEIARQAAICQSRQSKHLAGLVTRICEPVNGMLRDARASGRISQYPPSAKNMPHEEGETIARVLFVGYFNGNPSQVRMRFFHIDHHLQEPEILLRDHREGYQYGSDSVAALVMCGDAHFKKYSVRADYLNPLKSACEIARGFIDAWGDPKAREIDAVNCRTIGGQTQVYTVTPDAVRRVWPVIA